MFLLDTCNKKVGERKKDERKTSGLEEATSPSNQGTLKYFEMCPL